MPYRSKAQVRFLYSQHPDVAKEWTRKYGVPKTLPQHVANDNAMKKRNAKHWDK